MTTWLSSRRVAPDAMTDADLTQLTIAIGPVTLAEPTQGCLRGVADGAERYREEGTALCLPSPGSRDHRALVFLGRTSPLLSDSGWRVGSRPRVTAYAWTRGILETGGCMTRCSPWRPVKAVHPLISSDSRAVD